MAANDNLGPQFHGQGFRAAPNDEYVSLHNLNMMRHDLATGALSSGKEHCPDCGSVTTHDYLRHSSDPDGATVQGGVVQKTCNGCGTTRPRSFNWPVSENYYGN